VSIEVAGFGEGACLGRGEELGDRHHGDRPDEGEPLTIDLVASSRRPVVAREEGKLSTECGIDQRLPVDAHVGDHVDPENELEPKRPSREGPCGPPR
jgi:hypothetical protein